MARKSRKAEKLKQEIISSVPAAQRKMITQPITFTYLNGEISMMQTRIQAMIMDKLQERIAKALKQKAESGFNGDLFSDADFAPLPGGKTLFLTFDVKYSELGVDPSHYKDVDMAAKAMQSIVYEKDVIMENGSHGVEYTVVFDKVTIPNDDDSSTSAKERRDTIKLRMLPETAHDLFRITPYHRYLKDAIFLFSSGYTGRIYLLINANKQVGDWTIEYEKLRKILLTSYDRATHRAVVDKYKDFHDFKKRVLEPARKEIADAADRVDCTFDYELKYPEGKKRGTPEAIIFHIHLTDLGRNIKQAQLESQEAVELRNLLCSVHLTVVDANRLMKDCPTQNLRGLYMKAQNLKQHFADVKAGKVGEKRIDNPRLYALTTLKNYILEHTPLAEEVKEENSPSPTPPSGREDINENDNDKVMPPPYSALDFDYYTAAVNQHKVGAKYPELYDDMALRAVYTDRVVVSFPTESAAEVLMKTKDGKAFMKHLTDHFGNVRGYSTALCSEFTL